MGSRRIVWNWNNPGSYGYTAGNNHRVITTPTDGTGRYKIHNDDHWGGFTIGVEARQTHIYAETPSNIFEYANASFGWTDFSVEEFNPGIVADMWYIDNAGLEGFDLLLMPAYICPRGFGVGELQVYFGEMDDNIFWDDMELWLNILEVPTPGTLNIMVEGAEFPVHNLFIEVPGIYTVHLGAMTGGGKHTTIAPFVDFHSDPTTGPSFGWDSWALRTIYDATVPVKEKAQLSRRISQSIQTIPTRSIRRHSFRSIYQNQRKFVRKCSIYREKSYRFRLRAARSKRENIISKSICRDSRAEFIL